MTNRDEIARQAKAGQIGAVEALCLDFAADVKRSAAKVERSARYNDLDDLIQEGYLVLFECLESWEPAKSGFEAYLRLRLSKELKHLLYTEGPIRLPEKVGGAVRSIRAKEADGEAWTLEGVAASWSISNPGDLRQALDVNNDPERALEAMNAPTVRPVSWERVSDALCSLELGDSERSTILAVQEVGVSGMAAEVGVSFSTARRRYHRALACAVHPCQGQI